MHINLLFKKRWFWLIFGALMALAVLSVISAIYFTPWLKNKLEESVHQQTKGVYTLQLHGFDAGILSGTINADSLHFIPDYSVWDSLNTAAKSDTTLAEQVPRTLLDLKVGAVKLAGVNFLGVLRGKSLDLNTLLLHRPVLVFTEMRKDTTQTHEPLHQSLQGIAKGLEINSINIEDGILRVRLGRDAVSDFLLLEKFSIRVKDLKLDSLSFTDSDRAYYAQEMAFETGKAVFNFPDNTYRVQAAALKANTGDGTFNIGKLRLIPLLKNGAMARLKGMAVATMSLEVPEINLSGIDYKTHSRYNNLVARSVVFNNPSLSAYLDRKNHVQKGNKPLPHDIVQQLKTGLSINRVEVKNMHIRYEELAPKASETGLITFQNLNATIENLTNDKNRMSAKSPAVVRATTTINGEAPLTVTIRLNLLDPNAYHTIEGTAGPANPATLNGMLEPTAFISIKEGALQKSDFSMELYRNKATGNLNARYNNFKVDVLTKDEDTRQSFGKKILSKIANKAVIKSDNPEDGKAIRPGSIDVVRAQSKSVFNYWKDCLVCGFRNAAGINGIGANLQDPNR